MTSKIIWAVLLTALSSNCAQPPSDKNNTAKPAILQQYKETSEEAEWHEFNEKIDALVPRPPSQSAQPIQPPISDKLSNLIEGLKQKPDAFAYDSDEEILSRLKTPTKP